MARSNYKFTKRQKEIARNKKKEEKNQRKLEKKTPSSDVDGTAIQKEEEQA